MQLLACITADCQDDLAAVRIAGIDRYALLEGSGILLGFPGYVDGGRFARRDGGIGDLSPTVQRQVLAPRVSVSGVVPLLVNLKSWLPSLV